MTDIGGGTLGRFTAARQLLSGIGLPGALLLILIANGVANAAAPSLFKPWINGTGDHEPATQVQQLDADTFVIRQSFTSTAQAPFLFLLFGTERAMLLDTGDGGAPIRPTIERLLDQWLRQHQRHAIELVVAHSHSHSDHHQGDLDFAGRPDTRIVGLGPQDVAKFFHMTHWPDEIAQFDLGHRVLEVIAAPGHEAAHIVIYDPQTRVLLSGDTVLAGHVLIPIDEFQTFRRSVKRISDALQGKELRAILGTHVEMSQTPGESFDFGATSHPHEHVLELPASALNELQTALDSMQANPHRETHDEFIIEPVPHKVLAPYEYRVEAAARRGVSQGSNYSVAIADSANASCHIEGHPAITTREQAEQYIRESERQWAESATTNDTTVMQRILAEDLVWVLDGNVMDKTAAMDLATDGPSPFVSNKDDYVHLRFFGEVAVAQGSETWTMKSGQRGQFVWTDVWARRNGCWQIVNAQDTTVPQAKN